MTQREKFVELISYGPSKLPLSYVLASFDQAIREGQPSDVDAVAIETDHTVTHPFPESGGVTMAQAEALVKQMNQQVQASGDSGYTEDEDQENAEALANLRRVNEEARNGGK